MPDMRFIPRDDGLRLLWLRNFVSKLPGYAAALNVRPEEVAQAQTDLAVYEHVSRARALVDAHAQALTSWRNAARSGTALSDFPQPPDYGPPPPGAQPGIFTRTGKLAHRCKAQTGYTPVMGADLGIIAPGKGPVNLATVRPELSVSVSPGLPPVLRWRKNRMRMIEIQRSRNNGPFERVDIASRTTWTDKERLPQGRSEVWTYRAIYVVDDGKPVGQWSPTVTAAVSG